VSPGGTRQRMAPRVGAAGNSPPLGATLSTRSDYLDCSENYRTSLRGRKKHPVRLILFLTVLLIVAVIGVLVLRADTLPGSSSAVHPTTGEEGSFSSSSSISQLPRTGGP
jgi:hypothetical protein